MTRPALLLLALTPALAQDAPRWIAHRGNSWIAPENTLAAVRSALALDPPPDFVEIDVHATLDGVLAVIHDEDLLRTAREHGVLAQLRWEQVREADAGFAERFGEAYRGERVPRLVQVLDAVRGSGVGVMIEVKAHGAGGRAARLVAERGESDRHVLASFHADVIVDASLVAPGLRTLLLVSEPGREHVELARRCGASILGVGQGPVDADLVARARAAGLELWAWTVDDPLRADELLALGVDGIISNRVGFLRPGWLANGVTAHRGASARHPENTLAAFRAGIVAGADWLECDVRRCGSGELVVTHDASTGRVAGHDLVVAETTLAGLARLDVAVGFRGDRSAAEIPPARMPTLEQVLGLVMTQRRTRLSIQPKDEHVDACVALVHQLGAQDWVGFNDGDLGRMRRVKQLAPELPVFWDVDASEANLRTAHELGFEGVVMPQASVTARKVARLLAAGIEPGAWTVNGPQRMRELLALGVARIYTDEPLALLTIRSR